MTAWGSSGVGRTDHRTIRPRSRLSRLRACRQARDPCMRIDLIGHASLLVRSGDLALLTDPWWAGPAYRRQWFAYPFPVPERYRDVRPDALYLSHGHEDHMHEPTLRELDRGVRVLIPRL